MSPRNILSMSVLVFLLSPLVFMACDDKKKSSPADSGPDGGTDADGGPDADPGRGDPADFPEDCILNCGEACERLDDCGGADHPTFPMENDECNTLCDVAYNGYMWDDVSGNFRCCVSQEDCVNVAGCGGWLHHPDTDSPCDDLCACIFGSTALGLLRSRKTPPPGYEWAPSVTVVRQQDESVDYRARYGAEVMDQAGFTFLSFNRPLGRRIGIELMRGEVHLPTFVDSAGRVAAATGDIIVIPEDPAALATARGLLASRGYPFLRTLDWTDRMVIALGDDGWAALDVLEQLNQLDGITAELDMLRLYEKRLIPNDPMFADQWHLRNTGQADPEESGGPQLSTAGADARVDEAWNVTTGDAATIVAILDDGVNLNHPDLAPNLMTEYNFVDDWESYLGTTYLTGHGTNCAGVAAAKGNNGIGVSGVCPDCTLLPAMLMGAAGPPTMGSFQITDVELADIFTDLVDLGAGVISNSWGPGGEDPSVESSGFGAPALSSTVSAAFAYAETDGRGGLGTLILYASGNSNQDADTDTYVAYDNVVAVGAIDDGGLKSYYSSYGTKLDVVAPSNGALNGITTTSTSTDAATDPQYTYEFGGTSSSTPFVAGVVGLILSANSSLTAAEVRQILTDSATEVDPVWGDWNAGFSPYYGHGAVNAYKAVQLANGTCVDPDSCPAPSDDCGAGCGTGMECDSCRTHDDCAAGYVCQALPALGEKVCVRQTATDDCATDFEFVSDHCIPTRAACSLCAGPEVCNGRDDDCDGEVDDGVDCDSATIRCLQQGRGCPADNNCAATACREACDGDEDCEEDAACKAVKTRYGDLDSSHKVCDGGDQGCPQGCSVLASSLEDPELEEWIDCVQEASSCGEIFSECVAMLPINM